MTELSQESLQNALLKYAEHRGRFELNELVITRDGLISALTSGDPELRDTALTTLLDDVFDAYTGRQQKGRQQ